MTVDILCKVVDNLGDIGFVYRLARALSELPGAPRLRLVVDDLAAFAGLCPAVRPDLPLQTVGDWLVVRRDEPAEEAVRLFRAERPRLILECYACGRPAWFDSILFDESDPVPRRIVNLEYLTAESWAPEFHLLPSFTRSPLVRKSVFMPGFVPGTGGLVLDASSCSAMERRSTDEGSRALRRELLCCPELAVSLPPRSPNIPPRGGGDPPGAFEGSFWVFVFSYEHDFSILVADLASFSAERPVLALVASGRSSAPFLDAWNRSGRPFPVLELPLLPQTRWDQFLAASDFAMVRGEESLSRACLSGRPFLWQCYPFADAPAGAAPPEKAVAPPHTAVMAGQLPKVFALLDLVRPYLVPADYARYERLTLRFNGAGTEKAVSAAGAAVPISAGHAALPGAVSLPPAFPRVEPAPGDLLAVLRAMEAHSPGGLADGFAAWAADVRKIGNLAANLLTYMRDLG